MLKWTILTIFVDHVGFDAPRMAHNNFQWYDFNDQESCEQALIDYQKNEDGRLLINLIGISRFKISKEIPNKKLYREFQVNYDGFNEDTIDHHGDVDTKDLLDKAKVFFEKNGLLLNWREFKKLDYAQKINTLAMIAPITNEEKQKLIETISLENKVSALSSIISFYLHETNHNNRTVQ